MISQAARLNRMMVISQLNRKDTGLIRPPREETNQTGPSRSLRGSTSRVPSRPMTTADSSAAEKPAISTPRGSRATRRRMTARIGHCRSQSKGPMGEDGIAPGTLWADVPADWACPDCGVAKADFEMAAL